MHPAPAPGLLHARGEECLPACCHSCQEGLPTCCHHCRPPLQYVVSRRGLPESEARWFFQQLMLGMDYCHRKGACGRPCACLLLVLLMMLCTT